jgi:hypothetical protein
MRFRHGQVENDVQLGIADQLFDAAGLGDAVQLPFSGLLCRLAQAVI